MEIIEFSYLGTITLYILITLLSVFMMYKGKKTNNSIYMIIVFFILVIPSIFRYDTGIDYPCYLYAYKAIADNANNLTEGLNFFSACCSKSFLKSNCLA